MWKKIAALAIAWWLTPPAFAQSDDYPAKQVRVVSSYLAGGPNDVFSRILAQALTERFGHSVIVENRTGADGRIGAEAVARAQPDGYTLLMLALAHTAHPSLYANMPYDVEKDFSPASKVASLPLLLVVNPSLPVKNVKALIAIGKSKPGEINFASAGVGTSQHLAMELFNSLAGVRMTHVPYKGLGPAFSDIINGQVVALMCPIASALPFVKAGRLRALAITTRERSPLVADVPTVKEATGIDGVYVDTWHGIVAPAGTPRTVVAKLSREIVQVVSRTDVRERFVSQGAVPSGNSPDEFAAEIRREIQKWRKVIKEAGIKAG